MTAIDPETISFPQIGIADYCQNLTGEVVPIIGSTETGIVLAERNPCFFSGDTNSGKTFLMLQMMESLITGKPFLSKFRARPTDEQIVWINLDREGVKDRMVAMGFPSMGWRDQIRCLDFTHLQGLDFENDSGLLPRIAHWTGARYVFIDNVNLLVKDSANNALGQSFARGIKEATQAGLQIIGTTQNKKNRAGEDNDGVGSVLGSAHIGGAGGSIFILKRTNSVYSTKIKQQKSVDGGEYISGTLTHDHGRHSSRFAGGDLLGALMVRGCATVDELAADIGVTENTVRTRLQKMDPSLFDKIEPTERYANGGQKPVLYQYTGPNSDSTQLDSGPQLKTLSTPNSTSRDVLPVKEIA